MGLWELLGGKQLFAEVAAESAGQPSASGSKRGPGGRRAKLPLGEASNAAGAADGTDSEPSTPASARGRGKAAGGSKSTAPKPAEPTPSAGGFNLPKALSGSQAGQILAALDSISETLRESNLLQKMDLSFPEIAVVGQESTGKSSVLERVLGLPLFPRGADITTRMPVRLRLSHLSAADLRTFCAGEKLRESEDGFYIRVSLVSAATGTVAERTPFEGPIQPGDVGAQGEGPCARINAIMKKQTAGTGNVSHGVDETNVLQLEVKSRKLSDLKLLDLPGVVGGSVEGEPSDMDQRTKRLVTKYLHVPDTLVLIVAEATASSIRNSSAFSLVADAGKASKSLGVLTKADGCAGPSLTRLKERLAGKAKDLPTLGHGYVSLVNRDSSDERHLTIAEAEAAEAQWFAKHLPAHKDAHGGDVLIQKLVSMLVTYIKDEWADKALATLRLERRSFREKAAKLGFKVKESEPGRRSALLEVVAPIAANLRKELGEMSACKGIHKLIRDRLTAALLHNFGDDKHLDWLDWVGAWSDMLTCLEAEAEKAIQTLTTGMHEAGAKGGQYQSPILSTMLVALQKDEKLPLRAKRFDNLHVELLEMAADALKAARPELLAKMKAHLTALHERVLAANEVAAPGPADYPGLLSPNPFGSTPASVRERTLLSTLKATFTAHVVEKLAKSMAYDVLAVTHKLLASAFGNKDKITAALLARKTGLAILMQEDAASAAERRKLGTSMAGLRSAMVSIAGAVGKALEAEDAATPEEEEIAGPAPRAAAAAAGGRSGGVINVE